MVLIFMAICNQGRAQSIPVKNSVFQFDVGVHGAVMMPRDWSRSEAGKDDSPACRVWNAPNGTAVALRGGADLWQAVSLPPLPENLSGQSVWSVALAIDLLGVPVDQQHPGKLAVRIRDPETDQVLAEGKFQSTREAPISTRIRPRVWASSFQRGSEPERALDGNSDTIWHSKWGDDSQTHWLAIDLGEVRKVSGFSYTPRKDRGNGTIKDYRLEISQDGVQWKTIQQGTFDYSGDDLKQVVKLSEEVECRAVRLWADSRRGGSRDINGSCAEWELQVVGGWQFTAETLPEPAAAPQREFLIWNPDSPQSLDRLQLEIQAEDQGWIVIDRVHLFYVPRQATAKMAGKANGVSGPDVLGAGSYGFQALMIHQYPALPVIQVAEKSPAHRAGLRSNDLIVGINDQALPPGNVEPGYDWLERSHEALLGRAAVEAFAVDRAGRAGEVRLNVLREGQPLALGLRLNLPEEIGREDFLTNPRTLALLNKQLMENVVASQRSDGEWPGGSIQTALGGLALLSTGDRQHAARIKAAANWLCQRHGEPDTGFYWHPSFAGIFLSEYYLATGDRRVLPVMERMLRQMASAIHTSKWGTETFGHGPRGLPYENKSLVAVMVHCLVFESLAARCGLESNLKDVLDAFIESAWSDPAQGGHGALGYNASFKDLDEFWSRTGLLMLALKLDDRRPEMRTPMAEIMLRRHPWFRNSHAYGEPGGALGLIGLSQENPVYFREVFSQYRWWFGVAWEPGFGLHYTPPHMGAPYMEGPVLFNNAYAIVTNIHKQSLHITGGTQTNWLKVDRIPVPLSEVLILQDTGGRVSLRCKIPGPEIRYTVDGSEPNLRSSLYRQPFSIRTGATVKAIAVDRAQTSPVASRKFAMNKSQWKIISASGHRDPQKSVERAGLAIDGDSLISWVTDVGENAAGYPHQVVIDLGQPVKLAQLDLLFRLKEGTPRKILVHGASDQPDSWQPLGQLELADYAAEVGVSLDSLQAVQFLRIELAEPFTDSQLLMLGEIELKSADR
jgi:hypothetical protein